MKRFLHKLYVGYLSLTGKAIDIVSGAKYPAGELSNFAPHEFTFRGIRFHCMEGLLQGLKFQDTDEQNKVFGLTGKEAKSAGKLRDWSKNQTLYWQGEPMNRNSEEYRQLLEEAYSALAQNQDFQKALRATAGKTLYHTIGKTAPKDTVLTEKELCDILTKIREVLLIVSDDIRPVMYQHPKP